MHQPPSVPHNRSKGILISSDPPRFRSPVLSFTARSPSYRVDRGPGAPHRHHHRGHRLCCSSEREPTRPLPPRPYAAWVQRVFRKTRKTRDIRKWRGVEAWRVGGRRRRKMKEGETRCRMEGPFRHGRSWLGKLWAPRPTPVRPVTSYRTGSGPEAWDSRYSLIADLKCPRCKMNRCSEQYSGFRYTSISTTWVVDENSLP